MDTCRRSIAHAKDLANQLHQRTLFGAPRAALELGDGAVQDFVEDATGERVHGVALFGREVGQPTAKAHYAVKPGDTLTFPLGHHIRVIKILALGTRRGPATEAQALYEDLDPPQQAIRVSDPAKASPATRDAGSGRPTKRERRATDRLLADRLPDGD